MIVTVELGLCSGVLICSTEADNVPDYVDIGVCRRDITTATLEYLSIAMYKIQGAYRPGGWRQIAKHSSRTKYTKFYETGHWEHHPDVENIHHI